MLTLCKSTILGAGVFGRCRYRRQCGSHQSQCGGGGRQWRERFAIARPGLAALPPSTATPVPNSVPLPETKNYQVPSDFDANVNLHPYTSGLGPCPHEPCRSTRQEAPSHYNH